MKFFRGFIAVFIGAAILLSSSAYAAVSVKGYTRKDGTYVAPHYRSNPDGNPYNNWSYPGNVNPYTGKVATGNPDTYLNNYYNSSPSTGSYSTPSYLVKPSPLPSVYSAPSYSPAPKPTDNIATVFDPNFACKVYPGDPGCSKQKEEEDLKRSLQAQIQILLAVVVQLQNQLNAKLAGY